MKNNVDSKAWAFALVETLLASIPFIIFLAMHRKPEKTDWVVAATIFFSSSLVRWGELKPRKPVAMPIFLALAFGLFLSAASFVVDGPINTTMTGVVLFSVSVTANTVLTALVHRMRG